MRAKKYLILLGAMAVCVGVLWASERPWAVTPPKEEPYHMPKRVFAKTQRDVLKGLQGVQVTVYGVQPEEQKYVSKKQLQNDVELLLRKSGIKVLTQEEGLNSAGMPHLYVHVNVVIDEEAGMCAVHTLVELSEWVVLERSPKPITFTEIWRVGKTGLGGLSSLKSWCRRTVKDLVEMFINDYLAANAKQATEESKAFDDIPEELAKVLIWVTCRNPQCKAQYQISMKEHFDFIEKYMIENPGVRTAPVMVCKDCGEQSVYEAVKCTKCGLVFEKGLKRGDYADRCPKCGHSQIGHDRKKAAEARRRADANETNK